MKEKDTAVEVALQAGQVLLSGWGKPVRQAEKKSAIDLVTEIDRQADQLITSALHRAFPTYGILSEEGSQDIEHAGARWIIDPLDGTTNYIRGIPMVAVSIGLEKEGELALGVIYNPITEELFIGEAGQGATRNGEPIHVADTSDLGRSVLASGFPYDAWSNPDNNTAQWSGLIRRVISLRCDGSSAMDLCQVACGRLDGYWERGIFAWDLAAGALIVREAGGLVSDYAGSGSFLDRGEIVAATPGLYSQILELVQNPAI